MALGGLHVTAPPDEAAAHAYAIFLGPWEQTFPAFLRDLREGRPALVYRSMKHQAKHFFYAAGWKKFEPAWNMVIRARQLSRMTPLLEGVLSRVTAESRPRADEFPAVAFRPRHAGVAEWEVDKRA